MTHVSMPTSSAFFRGQIAAQKGQIAPPTPKANASYEEQLFFRGYMKEIKKTQPDVGGSAVYSAA